MRWKNQGNLETYGVRLVGWPADIPMQNPSTLSAAQNTQILNALNEGTMQFLPVGSFGDLPSQAEFMHVPDLTGSEGAASDMDDFVKYDDLPMSGSSEAGVAETFALVQVKYKTDRLRDSCSHAVFRIRPLVQGVHMEFPGLHPFPYPQNVPRATCQGKSRLGKPRRCYTPRRSLFVYSVVAGRSEAPVVPLRHKVQNCSSSRLPIWRSHNFQRPAETRSCSRCYSLWAIIEYTR